MLLDQADLRIGVRLDTANMELLLLVDDVQRLGKVVSAAADQ